MPKEKGAKAPDNFSEERSRSKLTQLAYDKIKQAIITNKLKPGLPISGSQLAKYFQMSRTPIREAIQLLANEGLVEMKNGVGFYIKAMTLKELKDINEVRIALQCAAMRSAIDAIPRAELEEHIRQWKLLAKKLAAEPQVSKESIDRIVVMDIATHDMITRGCGNEYMLHLLDGVETRSTQVQYLAVDAGCALSTVEQHIEIIEAMLAKDLSRAQEKLEYHIRYSVDRIERNADYWATGNNPQFMDSYFNSVFDD